jgi:O-antigen ligase
VIIEATSRPAAVDVDAKSSLVPGLAWAATLAALIALTVVSGLDAHADAGPFVGVLLGFTVALVAARSLSSLSRLVAPAVVVGIGGALVLTSPASVLSAAPRAGPFGYSSITGAFFAQACIAALMLAVSPVLAVRLSGIVAALAFGWVTIATQTRTSAILLVVVLLGVVAARVLASPRRIVASFAAIVAVAFVVTVVLGATYDTNRSTALARLVDATVTERRQALWHDALVLAARNPLIGIGPGRFGVESPVARSDRDAPWAHEEFLQASAEVGIAGGVLLLALFGIGFARLARGPRVDALAVLGAASLAVLGVHACVEYVLQRPAVPLAAAALVGAGIGPFRRWDRRRARDART